MLEERKREVCDLIVGEIATAGKGGFAALMFFGEIRRRWPGPKSVRRAAWIGNLVGATGVSEEDLREFRDEITPDIKTAITDAHRRWWETMDGVWKRQIEQIDARLATENAK